MTDLSHAAQAVLDAMHRSYDHEPIRRAIAAEVLRAAVAHTQQHRGLGVWECDADELLAIAAELERSTTENP
jgi:hypothetical protein